MTGQVFGLLVAVLSVQYSLALRDKLKLRNATELQLQDLPFLDQQMAQQEVTQLDPLKPLRTPPKTKLLHLAPSPDPPV